VLATKTLSLFVFNLNMNDSLIAIKIKADLTVRDADYVLGAINTAGMCQTRVSKLPFHADDFPNPKTNDHGAIGRKLFITFLENPLFQVKLDRRSMNPNYKYKLLVKAV